MPWPAELRRLPRPGSLVATATDGARQSACYEFSGRLPLVVDGTERPSRPMADHLRSCAACQSELAGYRELVLLLRSLRHDYVGGKGPLLGEQAWAAIAEHLAARSRAGEHWRVAGAAALALAVLGGAALAKATRQARALTGATAVA